MKLLLWCLPALLACSTQATCPEPSGKTSPVVVGGTTSPGLLKAIPAEVRPLSAAPRKVSPDGKASITFLAQGHNAFVGKLELAPDAAVAEHQNPTEGYIHVLSGRASMVMDGQRYDVEPDTTIYMPAYAKVSVQNGPEPLVCIQVFAGPEPARKYDTWK